MKLFELFATLSLDSKDFNSDIETATTKGQGLGDQLTSIVAKGMAAGTAMYNFGRNAVSALWNTGKDLVQTAADVQAETAAYEATFKELKDSADTAFNAVADDTNILATRLRTVGTKAFSQFKGAGIDASTSLDTMETYLRYAADAAAYYDMSLTDVDERLRSFLRGNVEAGDMIGLFTSELQRNDKAMELYNQKWQDLNEAQRQLVMMDIIEDIYGQAGVLGQAAREGDSYANALGNMQERIRQVKAILGAPILEALLPVLDEFGKFLDENPEAVEALADAIGEIAGMALGGIKDLLIWLRDHGEEVTAVIEGIAGAISGLAQAAYGLITLPGSIEGAFNSLVGNVNSMTENPTETWEALNTPLAEENPNTGVSVLDVLNQMWGGGSNATGLNYVPYDNFRTRLHRGERILTAREAEAQDAQRAYGGGGIDYDMLAEAASQRPVVVYIDKKAAAMLLAREMDTQIGNRNIQQLMSMGG